MADKCPTGFRPMNQTELATTLASLRHFENNLKGNLSEFDDFFTGLKNPSLEQIDKLAMKLNTSKVCIEK